MSKFWLFLFVLSHIQPEYSDLSSKSLYSVRTQEKTDEKNSEFGHF